METIWNKTKKIDWAQYATTFHHWTECRMWDVTEKEQISKRLNQARINVIKNQIG